MTKPSKTLKATEAEKASKKGSKAAAFFGRLTQPFPEQIDGWRAVVQSAVTALFVVLVLYFVQPFDMAKNGLNPLLHCLGYGAVTFIVNLSYDWFCSRVLKIRSDLESWTLWKWLVRVIGLVTCIAIGNFLYFNASFNWQYFNAPMLGIMLANTFVIGIFPTIAFGLLVQFRASNANLQSAAALNPQSNLKNLNDGAQKLSFGEQEVDRLLIEASSVRYIEAMQNYVSVCYASDGKIGRNLIRQTLSKAEADCKGSGIMRCHRSFLVNTAHIEHVAGNAQGLKLSLSDVVDETVPVSRSYISDLRSALDKH